MWRNMLRQNRRAHGYARYAHIFGTKPPNHAPRSIVAALSNWQVRAHELEPLQILYHLFMCLLPSMVVKSHFVPRPTIA
jgi:hypothetical protein